MRGRSSSRQSTSSSDSHLPGAFIPCPIRTEVHRLDHEEEIKAYKLGKKRWSYNQCALTVKQEATGRSIEVVDCMQFGATQLSEEEQESGVQYQVRLRNGYRVRMNIFVVYDNARPVEDETTGQIMYEWPRISREHCGKEHCGGPILRTIQRFGKLGKRSGRNSAQGSGVANKDAMKDAKYMFVSIDEAGSHVKVKYFRLIAGMYETNGNECYGTAISGPIRVLANNDVPTGAAYIPLELFAKDHWEGWKTDNLKATIPDGLRQEHSRSPSSNETDYAFDNAVNQQPVNQQPARDNQASLPQLLLEHATNYSQDSDQGRGRLSQAYRNIKNGHMVPAGPDSATSPANEFNLRPRFLSAEEEAAPYLDSFGGMPAIGQVNSDFGVLSSQGDYSPELSSMSAHGQLSPQLRHVYLPHDHIPQMPGFDAFTAQQQYHRGDHHHEEMHMQVQLDGNNWFMAGLTGTEFH